MLDRVQLKYEAKAITKNAKESAYVFTLIYLAIGLVLDGIDYLVSGSPQTEVYGYLADYMPEAAVYLRGTEPHPAPADAGGVVRLHRDIAGDGGAGRGVHPVHHERAQGAYHPLHHPV